MSRAVAQPAIIDLGRMAYAAAYRVQCAQVDEVLAARDSGAPEAGRILLVEHDPVITVSRRPGAGKHLLASAETLAQMGVETEQTDRGGDITYHGPGQLVVYPILDLNFLNLGLHAYMRLLESAVIDACAKWAIVGERDSSATGVWVAAERGKSKIAAMGVRVRRWVSMHGLALNVDPDMSHFDLIVPCGLAGRKVTSLKAQLGTKAPSMGEVKQTLAGCLLDQVMDAAGRAAQARNLAAAMDTLPQSG